MSKSAHKPRSSQSTNPSTTTSGFGSASVPGDATNGAAQQSQG